MWIFADLNNIYMDVYIYSGDTYVDVVPDSVGNIPVYLCLLSDRDPNQFLLPQSTDYGITTVQDDGCCLHQISCESSLLQAKTLPHLPQP